MVQPALYGLIGYPLGHSFSPGYFNATFLREDIPAAYQLFPLERIHELTQLLEDQPTLQGLNVTIPYKEQVIPLLDEVDEDAAAIGAVNCIKIINGKTKGYNTDVMGFEQSLKPLLTPEIQHAIILGTGGAAKAVKWVLNKLNIEYISVSRKATKDIIGYEDLSVEDVKNRLLIINTTPLGMHPDNDSYPAIPYEAITEQHILYDLIYNPEITTFLQKGNAQGATIKNGLEMLQLQAEAAWTIWNS